MANIRRYSETLKPPPVSSGGDKRRADTWPTSRRRTDIWSTVRSAEGISNRRDGDWLRSQYKTPNISAHFGGFQIRLDFHDDDTIPVANPGEGLFMPATNHGVRVAKFCLADFLPYRLAVVTESFVRVFAAKYEEACNLTIPEVRALAVVAEYGTLSPTAVGQHTAMDKVKVSRATQSLVAKGMLRQSPDPNDGRGRLLRLTRKGTMTHARLVPVAMTLEAELFGDLSQADIASLGRILGKITTRVETIHATDPS
jgi:DNA-binding MarR family transcriptional regulator